MRIVWGYDPSRLGTISFHMAETGGGGASGTVTITTPVIPDKDLIYETEDPLTGDVATTNTGYESIAEVVASAMNAIGNATYVGSYDSNYRPSVFGSGGGVTAVTISSMTPSARYALGWNPGTYSIPGAINAVRDPVTLAIPAVGGLSEWRESEDEIGGKDLVGADGSVRGLVAHDAPRRLDLVVPWEPKERVWSRHSASQWDRTWERTLRRVRTVEPAIVYGAAGEELAAYLRHDGCILSPRLAANDYIGHVSIPLGFWVVGKRVLP